MHDAKWMTEELRLLSDATRRFLERELVPYAEEWERAGIVSREAWRKAGEAGLLCASIPDEYGGGGGTRGHDLVIGSEISRAGLGGGFGAGHEIHGVGLRFERALNGIAHQRIVLDDQYPHASQRTPAHPSPSSAWRQLQGAACDAVAHLQGAGHEQPTRRSHCHPHPDCRRG